ncbi:uncharacterized protein ACNS7B_024008 [Menidia menidia]
MEASSEEDPGDPGMMIAGPPQSSSGSWEEPTSLCYQPTTGYVQMRKADQMGDQTEGQPQGRMMIAGPPQSSSGSWEEPTSLCYQPNTGYVQMRKADQMGDQTEGQPQGRTTPDEQKPQHTECEELERELRQKLQEAESALKRKQEELDSLRWRCEEREGELKHKVQEGESALRQKQEELESFRWRITEVEKLYEQKEQLEGELKKKLQEAESALRQKQEELESFRWRCEEREGELKHKVQEGESALRQKQEELESFRWRSEHREVERKKNITEMKAFYKQKAETEKIRLEGEHRKDITEMEAFYKKKVQKAESALRQKQDELDSFRERMGREVSVSLKAGDTESINDPVSKTRLVEMYDNLKLLHWPKMKEALKAEGQQPQEARTLLQASFEAAAQAMKKKRQLVEEAFGAAGPSGGAGPQKVREYRQITLGNLKMAVFHSSKADLLQTHLPEHGGGLPQSELLDVGALRSECFWLGCLMALNSPPLQPDWENHTPGMDPWDLFPRDIKPYSAV